MLPCYIIVHFVDLMLRNLDAHLGLRNEAKCAHPTIAHEPFNPQWISFFKDVHEKLEKKHENHEGHFNKCEICLMEFKDLLPAEVYQKMEKRHRFKHYNNNVLGCGGCYLYLSPQLNSLIKEFQVELEKKRGSYQKIAAELDLLLQDAYQKLEGHDGCRHDSNELDGIRYGGHREMNGRQYMEDENVEIFLNSGTAICVI